MKGAEFSVNKPFHMAVCFNQKWIYLEDAKVHLFLNKYDFSDNRDSDILKSCWHKNNPTTHFNQKSFAARVK